MTESSLPTMLAAVDRWLDTMRGLQGYGGPVVHRWQDSLLYTGPGFDWRYEGIISGYLQVFERSGDEVWLAKAVRAGEDLVRGQVENGNFTPSSFEVDPQPGGTPHEAACDLALLRLAVVLKQRGNPAWKTYAQTAEKNLRLFYLGRLWNPTSRKFQNSSHDSTLVPNKIATLIEALLVLIELASAMDEFERYIHLALESLLSCQVRAPGQPVDGAIDQSELNGKLSGRYFPYYIARCVPALERAYRWTSQGHFLESAFRAMNFVIRLQQTDGSFPQAVYANGRVTRYPAWIAGCGDILYAASCLEPHGYSWTAKERTLEWLMAGLLPSGGIRTGHGFSLLEGLKKPQVADFRDLLPVCGWVDKAFSFLASALPERANLPMPLTDDCEQPCLYRGRPAIYRESTAVIEVVQYKRLCYQWHKGEAWAQVY